MGEIARQGGPRSTDVAGSALTLLVSPGDRRRRPHRSAGGRPLTTQTAPFPSGRSLPERSVRAGQGRARRLSAAGAGLEDPGPARHRHAAVFRDELRLRPEATSRIAGTAGVLSADRVTEVNRIDLGVFGDLGPRALQADRHACAAASRQAIFEDVRIGGPVARALCSDGGPGRRPAVCGRRTHGLPDRGQHRGPLRLQPGGRHVRRGAVALELLPFE